MSHWILINSLSLLRLMEDLIRVNRDTDTPKGGGRRKDKNTHTPKKRSHFSADPVSRKGRNRSKSSHRKGKEGKLLVYLNV